LTLLWLGVPIQRDLRSVLARSLATLGCSFDCVAIVVMVQNRIWFNFEKMWFESELPLLVTI